MKFQASTFDEYVQSVKHANLHPELEQMKEQLPAQLAKLPNLIFCGPAGVGKYAQCLYFLNKYSTLKTDKRITIQFNKQTYTYHISEIHYEVDMNLLGCNSKLLWYDIFNQIVDIISVKNEKVGIIVCKNFHTIHTELLEIFYSYIQEYNSATYSNILVKFIILTEHVGFIPQNIINTCKIIRVARPNYARIGCAAAAPAARPPQNIKELLCGTPAPERTGVELICNNIIQQMNTAVRGGGAFSYTGFRDALYDIFIYNLDVAECVWYIKRYFAGCTQISQIMKRTYPFFQYFNNNYRPIYHLESYFINIIIQLRADSPAI
jgi:hypothetical protein